MYGVSDCQIQQMINYVLSSSSYGEIVLINLSKGQKPWVSEIWRRNRIPIENGSVFLLAKLLVTKQNCDVSDLAAIVPRTQSISDESSGTLVLVLPIVDLPCTDDLSITIRCFRVYAGRLIVSHLISVPIPENPFLCTIIDIFELE